MDLYTELKWIQAQALIGRGISSREHMAMVALETRLRTLEAENAALRLRLESGAEIVEAADHPPTLKHWLACPSCSATGGQRS